MSIISEEGPDGDEGAPLPQVRPGSELKVLTRLVYDLIVFLEGVEVLTDDGEGFLSDDAKPRAEALVRRYRGI